MSETTLLERPSTKPNAPTLPLGRRDNEAGELEMDRFTVGEGVVEITFPPSMSVNSVDDLADFFALFIKKVKRDAVSKSEPSN